MTGVISIDLHPRRVSRDIALQRIINFSQQFGEIHLDLACHAALPLVLTSDLLFRIWSNFLTQAPWTAVADILLSNLCREVGYELYEMDLTVRGLLLKQLREDEQYGQKRLRELAAFLADYAAQQLYSDDPDVRDLAQAQQWTALAYAHPNEAARKLSEVLSKHGRKDAAGLLRVTLLTESLSEPLAAFSQLLMYAHGFSELARSNIKSALEQTRQVSEVTETDGIPEAGLPEDRVYAFTPNGDILDLPVGATPIDFAYHVHTSIGNRCRGAKVNGKLVPLNTQLKTGDQVEIITSKSGGPSRDWLNLDPSYVKSARAREKIRIWLKEQGYEQNVSTGRGQLEQELNRLSIDNLTYEKIAELFRYDKVNDFLAAVGCDDIHSQTVVNRIVTYLREQSEAEKATLPPAVPEEPKPTVGTSYDVTIQRTAGLLTRLAKCCNPVKGDPIVGFTTRGHGITIHRQDCPNAIGETERLIQVRWGGDTEQTYSVAVRIQAYDREGLLREVSTIVADEKVSMSRVSVPDVNQKMANTLLTLHVTDLTQLVRILNRIEQLPNVLDVRRWKSS